MKKRIAAIDVGTTKVCTIMGTLRDASNLQISGVGIAPSRGIEKGLIANVDQAKVSILESVKKAEKMSGYELDTTYVGVNGNHINPINEKGTIATTRTDQMVRPDDLKRILDVARDIKTPVKRRLQAVATNSNIHQPENSVAILDSELDVESRATARACGFGEKLN